jgi:beta-lactamase class A
MSRHVPDSAPPSWFVPSTSPSEPPPSPPRRDRGRTAAIALAVGAACVLIGGIAAVAASLGRSGASPAAASALAPDRAAPRARSAAEVNPPGQHGSPFSAAMTAYLAGRAGTVSAAVYDVRTGQTWTLGSGQPQATASIVKVDILETLLAGQPSGLSAADQALAQSMIEDSDNDAATALWDAAGGPAGLRSYNLTAGLRQTTPSQCLACAGFPWPGWGLTTTTPADQVLLLRQLFAGPLLSPADRQYAMSLMENVEPGQRWGVSTGVPAGVSVALKNGWVPLTAPDANWQINSEGWISGDGRDYLVAVLATGNPSEQYGIDTIDALSAQLWNSMG